ARRTTNSSVSPAVTPTTAIPAGLCNLARMARLPRSATAFRLNRPASWSSVPARASRARSISRWIVSGSRLMAIACHDSVAGCGQPRRCLTGWRLIARETAGPPVAFAPMTETTRLQPGDTAPDFTLPDADGTPVTLSDYRGRRTILYVYPAAMTPGCQKQACDFRDSLDALAAAGFAVLGLSPDKPEKLAEFRTAEGLTFPLLSDVDKSTLAGYGAYGEKQMYGRTVVGVIRSTFVIGPDGRIERAMYGVKATGHVAKLRRELG